MQLSKKGKKGNPPKSVTMEVMFWWDDRTRSIHLATNDQSAETFHVSIREDATKPSGHPYLYRELKKCLKNSGATFPED